MASTFSPTRLYVGNLAATVDEYSLIQVFSKFGKISKLDYLFHKTGPAKGKPRGYAFVEYATHEEALKAIAGLNDKLVRGRKLSVTPAAEQSQHPDDVRLAALTGQGRARGRGSDSARPTAISLLKGQGVAGASTNRKIAALEAKLSALRKSKPTGSPAPDTPVASTSALAMDSTEGSTDRWLDGLLSPPNEGIEGTAATEAGVEGAASTSKEVKKIVVDAKAAGLPDRPWFDTPFPPTKRE